MELAWIAWAAILGFGIAGIFPGWLRLPRNLSLLLYVPLPAGLVVAFVVLPEIDVVGALRDHSRRRNLGGLVLVILFIRFLVGTGGDQEHGE